MQAMGDRVVNFEGRGARKVVVFFDGDCALCDGTVQFLMKHDRRGILRFAPLQGVTFEGVLKRYPRLRGIDSIVVVNVSGHLSHLLVRSRGVLHAVSALGGAWTAVSLLRVVPAPLLDVVYDTIGRIRYKLFGKRKVCQIPTPEQALRLLP